MWSELEKNIYSIFNNFNEIVKRSYTQQTKEELKQIIKKRIEAEGSNCNLNNDISNWNVSNVENMTGMFRYSVFNNDISKWNVCTVENISNMFNNSNFKGDISNRNYSHIYYAYNPFNNCPINKKPKIYESNIQ